MDLELLIDELRKPEYLGLSDAACVELINSKTVPVRQPVSAARIKRLAIELGAWSDIVLASEDGSDLARRRAALDVVAWLDDPRSTLDEIDLDSPQVQALVAAVVANGLLTPATLSLLQNMPTNEVRWVDQVNLGTVGLGHIINARRANG